MRRAASARNFLTNLNQLIRKHALQFGLISFVRDNPVTELPLAGPGLRRQDVPRKRVAAGYFPRARLLETFGRTLMCLQLGHKFVPGLT